MNSTLKRQIKRDSKGRFAPKVTEILAQSSPTKTLVNRIGIVFDRSGSMQWCWNRAMDSLDSQIAEIKRLSSETEQRSTISLQFFDNVLEPAIISDCKSFYYTRNSYAARGGTALNDAIGATITSLGNHPKSPNEDVTYLINIITDGEENSSHIYNDLSIQSLISNMQATGRWSVIFNCPPGHKQMIINRYHVPAGNVREWEGSVEGVRQSTYANNAGFTSYYGARMRGATATSDFFSMDARNFADPKKLTKLRSVNPKHNKVEKEVGISDFFQGKGMPYLPGMAFYELTKKEDIQDYKKLILLNKDTGIHYMDGSNFSVRDFLGMPKSGTARVDPINVGNFRVYVQSTSDNRKLVRGTTILYGV